MPRPARPWRDALIIGAIVIALLAALELGFRKVEARATAQANRVTLDPGEERATHPYAGEPWFVGFPDPVGRLLWGSSVRYDPYRGWWPTSFSNPYINIDTSGIRLTVQAVDATTSPRRIFLLGGSTMWGFTARDEYTIPSQVATRLRERGITDVEVVNMGQSGFTSTQGAVTLLLRLRDGDVPAAVVSLDGINDITTVFTTGRAGEVYNQDVIDQVFRQVRGGPVGRLRGVAQSSALVRGLNRLLGLNPPAPEIDMDRACRAMAAQYNHLGESLAAWGDALGFQTLFIWQPTAATTAKLLTPWERQLIDHPVPGIAGLPDMTRRCTTLVDSAMGGPATPIYRNFGSIFDGDTGDVFLDHYGHVTERANGIMADSIVALIEERLRR